MKSITIHNLDDSLNSLIREKARKTGLSLNKTIQLLLSQALGFKNKEDKGRREEYMDLFGAWSQKDESEFNIKTQRLDSVHKADWK